MSLHFRQPLRPWAFCLFALCFFLSVFCLQLPPACAQTKQRKLDILSVVGKPANAVIGYLGKPKTDAPDKFGFRKMEYPWRGFHDLSILLSLKGERQDKAMISATTPTHQSDEQIFQSLGLNKSQWSSNNGHVENERVYTFKVYNMKIYDWEGSEGDADHKARPAYNQVILVMAF